MAVMAKFHVYQNEPPLADYMTRHDRNAHPTLVATPGAPNKSCVFSEIMPEEYAGSGVNLEIWFQMTTAQTGTINLSGAFERVGVNVQDTDNDNFATAQSVTGVTVPSVSGRVAKATITFTNAQIAGVQGGEEYRLKVTRTGGSAAGNAEFRKFRLIEP